MGERYDGEPEQMLIFASPCSKKFLKVKTAEFISRRSDICRQTQFWRFDQTLFELFLAEPVVLRSPSISTHHSTMTSK
jgi:hypothetical protein